MNVIPRDGEMRPPLNSCRGCCSAPPKGSEVYLPSSILHLFLVGFFFLIDGDQTVAKAKLCPLLDNPGGNNSNTI